LTVTFGLASDFLVVGDWDGNGTTTVGVWGMGTFYLRNENTPGPAHVVVTFGLNVDQPVVGDWNGDGATSIGVYRPALSLGGIAFYWRDTNTTGPADGVQAIGGEADSAIAGDWDGNGTDTIGLRRQWDFYLADSNSTSTASTVFGYGDLTWVLRCWDGPGVFRAEACPVAAHGRSALLTPTPLP
jgi:hypothetical protein